MFRRTLEETEDFKAQNPSNDQRNFSTLAINWRIVLAGMMMSAMTTTTFYFITVYTTVYAKRTLEMSITDSLLATVFVGLSISSGYLWVACFPTKLDVVLCWSALRHLQFYQLSGFKLVGQ